MCLLKILKIMHAGLNKTGLSILFFVLLNFCLSAQDSTYTLESPDGRIKISINTTDTLTIFAQMDGMELLVPSPVYLVLQNNEILGIHSKIKKTGKRACNDTIFAPVASKRRLIPDVYNEQELVFRNNFSLVVRCYNDGFAYRFKTNKPDSLVIVDEHMEIRLPADEYCWFPEMKPREGQDRFHTSFEENYLHCRIDSILENRIGFTPLLIESAKGYSLLITESDLIDYPGMFITGNSKATNSLQAVFPPVPLKEQVSGDVYKQWIVTQRRGYIAKTAGRREFPWRVFVIASKDSELPSNDLVYRLASKTRLDDVSWIKPGRCTDEWITGINLFNVPFKAGLNTESYKYYIDFAQQMGLPYILLDAGWSNVDDLFNITPSMDMEAIVQYAREKGVGLWLWTQAMTLDRQLEPALEQFEKWGLAGFMTDFMDRNDQVMVNLYHRVAKAAAAHHLMLMYHGAFANAGFERTWPNALTREAVLGSEYNIWSKRATPDHDLVLPFTRMVSGPLDYEPILFNNATKGSFYPSQENVLTMGTRIHQLAMYLVYDSPFQVFAGNPGYAYAEPEFMRFMTSIPVVWDETSVLDGKCGEYIVTARRLGENWYLAAMGNWNEHELHVPCSFLGEGTYQMLEYADGINADRYAADYTRLEKQIDSTITLTLKLAPGGGYVARMEKQEVRNKK
jgi:alpha-glucosidase